MGHYANECPTVLRKRKLNFNTVLSDESNDEEKVILFASIEDELDAEEVMVIDEDFSVEEMLVESTDTMLIDNVSTSATNILLKYTNWYKMTLLNEMDAYSTDFWWNEDNQESNLQEGFGEIKNACEIIDEQCKIKWQS